MTPWDLFSIVRIKDVDSMVPAMQPRSRLEKRWSHVHAIASPTPREAEPMTGRTMHHSLRPDASLIVAACLDKRLAYKYGLVFPKRGICKGRNHTVRRTNMCITIQNPPKP